VLEVEAGWSCAAHATLLNALLDNCFPGKTSAIGCKGQRLVVAGADASGCAANAASLNTAIKE